LITKYLRYQVNFSVMVHLCNFNKQHVILAKFYINNASPIDNKLPYFSYICQSKQ